MKKQEKNKKSYFKNLKSELSKVIWPSPKEIAKYTFATILFVVVLALFFEGLNFIEAFVKGMFN